MAKKVKSKSATKTKASSSKADQPHENLKKLFLAGLGLADETNTKLHQTFDSLVKRGQIKQPQVKKAVDDIRKRVLARRKELEKKFQTFFKQNDLLKSKEVQSLLKKVETLEKQAGASTKKATSKPASAKTTKRRSSKAKASRPVANS